jgi:hypothetical protein
MFRIGACVNLGYLVNLGSFAGAEVVLVGVLTGFFGLPHRGERGRWTLPNVFEGGKSMKCLFFLVFMAVLYVLGFVLFGG